MPASINNQLSATVEKRARYFQRVQRCHDLIRQGVARQGEFLARVKDMANTFARFEETVDRINSLNAQLPEGGTAVQSGQAVAAFETLYYDIKDHESSVLRLIRNTEEVNPPAVAPAVTASPTTKVKLPTINVPVFNGDISEFSSWKLLFDQLIHTNINLSDIQKFSYLKSYVTGPAARCIDHIAFAEPSYPLAYQSLLDRYEKKRLLANVHLIKILNFSPLTCDDLQLLQNFIDVFDTSVQSLKRLEIDDLGEYILLQIGSNVLDPESRRVFESENIDTNFPKFENLRFFSIQS